MRRAVELDVLPNKNCRDRHLSGASGQQYIPSNSFFGPSRYNINIATAWITFANTDFSLEMGCMTGVHATCCL
jgi:hypothetical protein